MKRRKIIQSVVILSMLFLITACGAKEESMTKNLELQAIGLSKLIVDHRNGKVQISGNSDSDKIEVVATAKSKGVSMDKLILKLDKRDNTAYLDTRFEGQFFALGSGEVDLQIKVPKQLQLDIMSHRDGNIHISDMSSSMKIDNVNGDIQVLHTTGPLDIENRDGDIIVRDIRSNVAINNINGHIKVEQVEGSAEIHVGDGTLDIDQVTKDTSITQSGNGKINIGEVKGKVFQNKE